MFKFIEDKEVVLTCFGEHSDNISSNLIAVIENETKRANDRKSVLKRMPILIAECFQNILRHRVELNESEAGSLKDYFQVQIIDKEVIISSSNIIENIYIKELQAKIDLINSLSKEELKSMRREVLKDGAFSDKGGAGLGLIEMAIRTERKLQTRFSEVNEKYSQFFLVLTSLEDTESKILDRVYSEYNELLTQNIMLLYKGDVSWSSSSELIQILEKNLVNNELAFHAEKELSLIIEIIQNSAKHGLQINNHQEGIIALRLENRVYSLYSGNYLSESKAELLKKKLDEIDQSSLVELNELYKHGLYLNKLDEEGNSGLGLIEISRQTGKNFKYDIEPGEGATPLFFGLEVQLN